VEAFAIVEGCWVIHAPRFFTWLRLRGPAYSSILSTNPSTAPTHSRTMPVVTRENGFSIALSAAIVSSSFISKMPVRSGEAGIFIFAIHWRHLDHSTSNRKTSVNTLV
jgi:hypothetical protein